MAIPTVFVSSTFYDLRYARESLKRFIEQLGYLPVLSEDGAVFYDPRITAAEACLREVSNASLLVLLIGGRYGMAMPGEEQSVTNAEYQQALKDHIPVFALVEQSTYNDYMVYEANRGNAAVLEHMVFPSADSIKIFEFIDSVRGQTANNALVPFRNLSDIESYLKLQWAGLLHDSLTSASRSADVVDTLEMLKAVNERVELIASQILRSVGTPLDRVYVKLMHLLMQSRVASDLRFFGSPRLSHFLEAETVEGCARSLGTEIIPYHDPDEHETSNIISGTGEVTKPKLREMEGAYEELRTDLLRILKESTFSLEDIQAYEAAELKA